MAAVGPAARPSRLGLAREASLSVRLDWDLGQRLDA